jgi:cytochrome P450
MTQEALDLAQFEPEFNRDPYPLYKELREQGPARHAVIYNLPVWLVTRYAEGRQALADPRLKHDRKHATAEAREKGPWLFVTEALGFDKYMLASDPPDHTRLRKMVNKVFTPRRVEALRPWIQQITDDLIREFLPKGQADMVDELAYPIPIMVITELLGVPEGDRPDVRRWAEAFSSSGASDPAAVVDGFTNMKNYFAELSERKRAKIQSGDRSEGDMLASLIATKEEGLQELDANEVLAMCFQILVGGFETTANMISNGVLALLQHPDQLAALRADLSLIPNAIEEMIRYDAPVKQPWFRFTTEDVPIGDVVVPAGSVVVVNLAAANRDPDRYPDPDTFDIRRDASGQLGFSHGPHFCTGAPLARVEAEITFRTLLESCDNLKMMIDTSELEWRPSPSMRILNHLPVSFTPTGRGAGASSENQALLVPEEAV